MEEFKSLVKEVIETPSMLGSYKEMTIIDILKKCMVFTDSTLKTVFNMEFESFLQRLDRAEKMGIKRIDRINAEIKEWNDRIENDEFSEIMLSMINKTIPELFSANQSMLNNSSTSIIMQMLTDEEEDELNKQIIEDVFLFISRYNQAYFINPIFSKNGVTNEVMKEIMENPSVAIFEKINYASDFFGLSGLLAKQVIKVSENMIRKMYQMEYFDRLVEYRESLGYESDTDTSKSLTIPIKIKNVKRGKEIDLEQDAYAILVHYFKKGRIFLDKDTYLSDTSAAKAMQILSGFNYDNIRKKLGSLAFTYNQRVVVKEKLQEVIDLINKDLPKK